MIDIRTKKACNGQNTGLQLAIDVACLENACCRASEKGWRAQAAISRKRLSGSTSDLAYGRSPSVRPMTMWCARRSGSLCRLGLSRATPRSSSFQVQDSLCQRKGPSPDLASSQFFDCANPRRGSRANR